MPLQRVVDRDALADQPFAVIDQQPQVELGPVQVRRRQRVQAFAQRRPGDRERVDAVGLAAPARLAPRRRHQACCGPAAPARRARSETAPTSPRHAGSPPAPTPALRPGRAPSAATPPSPSRLTGPSARRAARRSSQRPRRSCASACGCPHRARSLTSSTSTSTELDARRTRLAWGDATLLSSHAGTSPTGDERHSESQSGPRADSVKASQLAAGRGPSPRRRTSPTRRIQTASVKAAATNALRLSPALCGTKAQQSPARGNEAALSAPSCSDRIAILLPDRDPVAALPQSRPANQPPTEPDSSKPTTEQSPV